MINEYLKLKYSCFRSNYNNVHVSEVSAVSTKTNKNFIRNSIHRGPNAFDTHDYFSSIKQ